MSSSSTVFVHPLVMMGMADHFTRNKLQGEPRAIGGFVGIQDGLKISLLDATEMKISSSPGLEIDISLLKRKLDLVIKVFPKYEFLGWYLVGQPLGEQDMLTIQRQVQALNESPLVVLMDSDIGSQQQQVGVQKKVLPITAYETVMLQQQAGGSSSSSSSSVQSFVEVQVQIETTDSERVIVDHVNNPTKKSTSSSSSNHNDDNDDDDTLTPHLATLKNAVQKLTGKVLVVRQFLVACAEQQQVSGEQLDHALIREAIACVNLLPALDAQVSAAQYNDQLSDTLLLSLLANITKQTTAANTLLEKFFIAHPSPGEAGEGGRGEGGGGSSLKALKRSGSLTAATPGGGGRRA